MQSKANYIMAIDPDTEKSGVAIIDIDARSIELSSVSFWDLPSSIHEFSSIQSRVCIEAGHKIKTNFHISAADTKRTAAHKHYSVGRCHQIGMLLVQFCQQQNFPFEEVLPLEKHWAGPDRKITHDELISLINEYGLSIDRPHLYRTNQEERDAALIALTRPEVVYIHQRAVMNKLLKPSKL